MIPEDSGSGAGERNPDSVAQRITEVQSARKIGRVQIQTTFALKPGSYSVREVVREAWSRFPRAGR